MEPWQQGGMVSSQLHLHIPTRPLFFNRICKPLASSAMTKAQARQTARSSSTLASPQESQEPDNLQLPITLNLLDLDLAVFIHFPKISSHHRWSSQQSPQGSQLQIPSVPGTLTLPLVMFQGRRRSPMAPAAKCTTHHLQDLQPARKAVQAGNIMSVKLW